MKIQIINIFFQDKFKLKIPVFKNTSEKIILKVNKIIKNLIKKLLDKKSVFKLK